MDQQAPPPDLPPAPDAQTQSDTPTGAAPRSRRALAVVAVVVAVVLVGGVASAFLWLRGSGEQLLTKIPATTDVVITAYLDPSAGQKANLFRMTGRLPGLGSREDLRRRLDGVLDELLTEVGLDHTDLGWIGAQVAVAVDLPTSAGALTGAEEPSVAVLVDADDEDAARATLQELRTAGPPLMWADRQVDGVTVSTGTAPGGGISPAYAIVDGTVVVANTAEQVNAVIAAAHGDVPQLQDSSGFVESTAGLPEGKLGLLYLNVAEVTSLLESIPEFDAAAAPTGLGNLQAMTGLALSLSAESAGLALDFQVTYDPDELPAETREQLDAPDHENPLLELVPATAYGVAAQQHIDTSVAQFVDELRKNFPEAAVALDGAGFSGAGGVLDSLTGDAVVEAGPGDEGSALPSVALLIGTDDEAAMRRALDVLVRAAIRGQGAFSSVGLAEGGAAGLTAEELTGSLEPKLRTEDYEGVEITSFPIPGGGVDVAYAVIDGAGVLAVSTEAVRSIVDTARGEPSILDDRGFTQALADVPATDGAIYIDLGRIVAAIREAMPPDIRAQFDQEVAPILAPLESFTAGMESDASHHRVRMFLRVT